MNFLIYFGHPAQYHFLKHSVKELRNKGHKITLIIKTKDVLERLLQENGEEYLNILPEGRRNSKIQILFGLFKRDLRLFKYVIKRKFDLFVGTDPSLSHVGWLLRIPVLTVLEDDIDVIPQLGRITFPFTTHIVAPDSVSVGKYFGKKIGYKGYMKLAYLHPKYFTPRYTELPRPCFLIRLSELKAHHDFNIRGIDDKLLDQIIQILAQKGDVFISSESTLPVKYKSFQMNIEPSEMHNFLSNTTILISDSQSMSMEAAMLGVPSIRFSSFAGKISVLEELEHKYQLTYGISPNKPQELIDLLKELTEDPDLLKKFQSRRKKMLSEKIDVTAFMVWLIENYPGSADIMKANPDYQDRFL